MVGAITMVRDESDIVEVNIRHMASQVDFLIVADNGSTDGTREKLESLAKELRMGVLDDPELGYYQARKMTQLATRAIHSGATWIVPFDCDERWYSKTGERIADVLGDLPPEALVAEATVLDHVAVDGEVLSPWRRAEILPLRKVAVRGKPGVKIHQGNHSAAFRGTDDPLTVTGRLQIRHFPHRSPEQMIRKARNGAQAYAATDLDETVGAHWRQWGQLSDEQLREVFFTYYHSADPEADGLVHDPAP